MMRLLVGVIVVVALVVGVWLGGSFGLGLSGSSGPEAGNSVAPKTDVAAEPSEETKTPSPEPWIKDGVLSVRIEGNKIIAGGKERSIEEIGRIALEHEAKVVIERAADARVRPREDLERALREKNVHVVVE